MAPRQSLPIAAAATDAGEADSKGVRTRQRLLDATAAEVARHGVAGTSINAIAAAAGLKTGSVYFHYNSKDELVAAMMEAGLLAALDYLDRSLKAVDDADPAGRLMAAVRAHAASVHDFSTYTRAVLGRTSAEDLTGATARKLRKLYVRRWTQLISSAQLAHRVPANIDPRLLCDLVIGAINAAGLTGQPPDQIVDAIRALILHS